MSRGVKVQIILVVFLFGIKNLHEKRASWGLDKVFGRGALNSSKVQKFAVPPIPRNELASWQALW